MATYRGKPAGELNRIMKIYIPETDGCSYADFPMHHGPKWLRGNDQTPKGQPCFIRTENFMPPDDAGVTGGFKTGYIWGAGPFGYGYYHLTTKNAHNLIYARIVNGKVTVSGAGAESWCPCFGGGQVDPRTKLPTGLTRDEKDDMRLLFHARSVATQPSDQQALRDQIGEATATAQGLQMMDGGGNMTNLDLVQMGRANKRQGEIQKENPENMTISR